MKATHQEHQDEDLNRQTTTDNFESHLEVQVIQQTDSEDMSEASPQSDSDIMSRSNQSLTSSVHEREIKPQTGSQLLLPDPMSDLEVQPIERNHRSEENSSFIEGSEVEELFQFDNLKVRADQMHRLKSGKDAYYFHSVANMGFEQQMSNVSELEVSAFEPTKEHQGVTSFEQDQTIRQNTQNHGESMAHLGEQAKGRELELKDDASKGYELLGYASSPQSQGLDDHDDMQVHETKRTRISANPMSFKIIVKPTSIEDPSSHTSSHSLQDEPSVEEQEEVNCTVVRKPLHIEIPPAQPIDIAKFDNSPKI